MLRKIILIGLVSAMLAGLVAVAQEPVTVEFWHRFSESRLPYLYQLSEWFEAEYPHITIEWVYQGSYSALQQKINGAVVAGEVPTMTIFYENWIPPVEDALLSLGSYLTDEEKADILPGLRYPDYLTVPFNKSIMILIYIEEFVPVPPTTWDEMYAIAVSQTVDEDEDGVVERYGMGFRPSANPEQFFCLLAQNNGSILSEDLTEVTLGNEAGLEALNFYASLAPYSWITGEYLNSNMGYVAMAIDTSAGVPYWESAAGDDYTVKTAPLPMKESMASQIQGTNIGIFKDSPQAEIDAAVLFTQFLLRPEMTGYWAAMSGYMPVTFGGLDSAVWKYKEATFPETVAASTTMMAVGVSQPAHANYGDMRDDVLGTMCEEIMLGAATVEDALAAAVAELEALLDY